MRFGLCASHQLNALPSRASFYQQTITRWAAALTISQVEESDADIVFAGVASGGVGKTTNNGTTWKPVLGKEGVSTIDEIAVDPDSPGHALRGSIDCRRG